MLIDTIFKSIARYPTLYRLVKPVGGPIYRRLLALNYHLARRRTGWAFPRSMAHASGLAMARGHYEPGTTRAIRQSLNSHSIFLDVGANVGYFSRVAAQTITTTGRIFAFEPEPENYQCLIKNTDLLRAIVPIPLAVFDTDAILELRRSSHSACHSLLDTQTFLTGSLLPVASITIDTFYQLYLREGAIDLIKIDVEGAEAQVLSGMRSLLERRLIRSMIVEYTPSMLLKAGRSTMQLWDLLSPHFEIETIRDHERLPNLPHTIDSRTAFEALSEAMLNSLFIQNINLWCRLRS